MRLRASSRVIPRTWPQTCGTLVGQSNLSRNGARPFRECFPTGSTFLGRARDGIDLAIWGLGRHSGFEVTALPNGLHVNSQLEQQIWRGRFRLPRLCLFPLVSLPGPAAGYRPRATRCFLDSLSSPGRGQ